MKIDFTNYRLEILVTARGKGLVVAWDVSRRYFSFETIEELFKAMSKLRLMVDLHLTYFGSRAIIKYQYEQKEREIGTELRQMLNRHDDFLDDLVVTKTETMAKRSHA